MIECENLLKHVINENQLDAYGKPIHYIHTDIIYIYTYVPTTQQKHYDKQQNSNYFVLHYLILSKNNKHISFCVCSDKFI